MNQDQDYNDVLTSEVRKLEEEAEKLVEDAVLKKEKIISEGHKDAAALFEKKKKEIEESFEKKIDTARKAADKKKEKILAEGDAQVDLFVKKAEKNKEKAKKEIFKLFEKKIEKL